MKLLLYTHAWAPQVGGVEIITRDLAKGLVEWSGKQTGEEIEITLVTQTSQGNMDDSKIPFRVVRRPSKRQLFSLVRAADIVHIASAAMVPLALAWALRKPLVVEHHGYQSACPNGLLLFQPDRSVCPGHFLAHRYGKCVKCNQSEMGWLGSVRSLVLTFPRRWLAHRATVHIAPSKHIGKRIALPRTRVIPHGVPKYLGTGDASSTGEAGIPYFAYVGRLVAEKGLPVLLRACSRLAEKGYPFRLIVIGGGPERAHLEKMTVDLELTSQIDFLGSVPVEQIPALLRGSAAVIMPSIWEDIAPLVAYEQLMHGNLVIASDIGGLGEIIDGVGLKFPPGNAEALAACMRQVIDEPEFGRSLKSRAQDLAQKSFTLERMVSEHLSIFREVARSDAK